MPDNPYSDSLEARVLSATPLELVTMLYDGALNAVRAARAQLRSGDIPGRGRSVAKAVNILIELSQSLNFEAAGELSKRLDTVYRFMRHSLLDANFRQTDEGLAATESLLVSLREAWYAVSTSQPAVADVPETAGTIPALPWGAIRETSSPSRYWSA